MALLEYFSENPASFWFTLGALALIIELVVLGMSTIVLFLVGLGSLITALLVYLGVIPEGWLTGFAVMGILSFLLGILLWKPLKQYQAAEPSRSGQSSDFVGYEFTLSSLIDRETQSTSSHLDCARRPLCARDGRAFCSCPPSASPHARRVQSRRLRSSSPSDGVGASASAGREAPTASCTRR